MARLTPGSLRVYVFVQPGQNIPAALASYLNSEVTAGRLAEARKVEVTNAAFGYTLPMISYNVAVGSQNLTPLVYTSSASVAYNTGIIDGLYDIDLQELLPRMTDTYGVHAPGPTGNNQNNTGQAGPNPEAAEGWALVTGGNGNDYMNNRGLQWCSQWIPAKYYYIAAAVAGGIGFSSEKRTAQIGFGVAALALVLMGSKCQNQTNGN